MVCAVKRSKGTRSGLKGLRGKETLRPGLRRRGGRLCSVYRRTSGTACWYHALHDSASWIFWSWERPCLRAVQAATHRWCTDEGHRNRYGLVRLFSPRSPLSLPALPASPSSHGQPVETKTRSGPGEV